MSKTAFIDDIQALREQARNHINNGVITQNYDTDVEEITKLLNINLATELICTLRYKNHHYRAKSLGASVAASEFLEHAKQEQEHADQLAERISQLGEIPNYNPEFLTCHSHAEYTSAHTLDDMIRENLIAERIAIETYRRGIQFIGDKDPTTRRLLENILAVEEEHAGDMLDLKDEYEIIF